MSSQPAFKKLPTDCAFDSTLALWWKGYAFIQQRCEVLKTDVFQTRLLLQPVICMRGEKAARLFYDETRFMRHGAMPVRVQKTLVGEEGVQGLDDGAHRHRKHLFITHLMSPEGMASLAQIHSQHWQTAIARWPRHTDIVLFDEAQKILCRSICQWVGVPLAEQDVARRAREFGLMIDSGARLGWHHWRGRHARKSSEAWIRDVIFRIRNGQLTVNKDTVLHAMANYRDQSGKLLPIAVCAVEVINVLRPTVAIAQLIIYAALAMHQFPAQRPSIGNSEACERFALEVRRYFPFFPFLAAKVRSDFTWNGYLFKQGQRALLDIYATNHHPAIWTQPDRFDPDRFIGWQGHPYQMIANGGGSYDSHHRCPGEHITMALLQVAQQCLSKTPYEVPPQNLSMRLNRIPCRPASGFIIRLP